MLTKVLFTIAVVLIVAFIFRHKTDRKGPLQAKSQAKTTATRAATSTGGVSSRSVIYAILGLIVVLSALLFVLHWQDQHEIVNIEVVDGSGLKISYQAYKMSIEGRRFITLDGREVTLGDNDRIEMSATE
ncbi:MAG: hypothetical protein DHS20C01_07290 [marine bacterium B5-7]|nr:MAG: hypothetical protein DHS20C01_07290 [marine bacterium B5-7]